MAVKQFLEEFILLVLIALECQYFQKVGHYLWGVLNLGRYHRQTPIRHNNAGLGVATSRSVFFKLLSQNDFFRLFTAAFLKLFLLLSMVEIRGGFNFRKSRLTQAN